MSEVDWRKAPEGATRYHPETSKIIEHWLKMVDDEEWIWTSAGKRWMPHIDPVEGGEYYERPAPTWSDEGLPPVGTVCELKVVEGPLGEGNWGPAEIVYSSSTALVWRWQGWTREFGSDATDVRCRPLRTPEQIAAEEQADAVRAACAELDDELSAFNQNADCSMAIKVAVEAMIKAGYRKVEGGAA